MDMNDPLIQIGTTSFSALQVLMAAAAVALLLLLVVAVLAFRAQAGRKAEREEAEKRTGELEYRLAELAGTLRGFAAQAQSSTIHLQRTLDERLDQVGSRVGASINEQSERTTLSLGQLNERMAVIDAAQRNLTALSGEMISLKDILNNKQTRGAFGQGRMEAIIKDGLPSRAYAFQPTLSNNTRPDCLIFLPDSPLKLVVDAKFPLESYTAFMDAGDETLRAQAAQKLRGDVGRHVKDIAEKYLIPGETHETAIMFVPSESIYFELNERFDDTVQKAQRMRVILASPSVLMLMVQTLQAITKDVAMREQAHVIKTEVAKLLDDVARVKERALDLRRHFDMANGDLEKLTVSADKVSKRGLKIESLDLEEPVAVPEVPRPRLVGLG